MLPAVIALDIMHRALGDTLYLNEEQGRRYLADPYDPLGPKGRKDRVKNRKPH